MNSITLHDLLLSGNYVVTDEDLQGLEWAETRESMFLLPESDGAFISRHLTGVRVISLPIRVKGETDTEYREAREALIDVLRPKMTNGVVLKRMATFVLDDSSVRVVEYIGGSLKLPYKHALYADGVVILKCPDPTVYGELTSESVGLSEGGGNDLPNDLPNDLGASIGGSMVVVNDGDADTYPIVTLRGASTNPTMTNQTTGVSLSLSSVGLAIGETITIDMKNHTIKKGTQNYFYTKTPTSDFWSLQGGSNTIVFTDSAYSENALLTVSYRSAWGGA